MTKKVVLTSLKERINHLIDHSYTVESHGSGSDFDKIYFSGFRTAMQQILSMIEEYE